MKDISNGTVGGALAFLVTLVEKGRLSNGQAKPLRIAITKVFSAVDGATWEQTNIRGVDTGDYMQRFINKTDVFYTNESLQTYKSRITRALKWYEQFLDNPGWTPQVKVTRNGPEKQIAPKKQPSKQHLVNAPLQKARSFEAAQPISESALSEGTELITYPFPLANGQTAKLSLPFFLTKDEAKRLAAFIDSVAMPEPTHRSDS